MRLKIGRFDPAYVGQPGTYVAVVDDRLRRSDRHAPRSGSCCARAAATPWSATPWPAPPPRWPSRQALCEAVTTVQSVLLVAFSSQVQELWKQALQACACPSGGRWFAGRASWSQRKS